MALAKPHNSIAAVDNGGSTKSGNTLGNSLSKSRKKMQMRLAVIMSLTVLEFNIFQVPLTILVLTVLFQTYLGPLSITSEFTTVAFCFLWADSIINPLWTSFISKRDRPIKVANVNRASRSSRIIAK